MTHTKKAFVLILFLLLVTGRLGGKNFSAGTKSFTLSNGMTFYVYERHSLPIFAAVVSVKAGSVDEKEGQTGLAHLFEHMAFKGTPVIGAVDFEKEKKILEQIDVTGCAIAAERRKGDAGDPQKIETLKNALRHLQTQHRQYIIKNQMADIYARNGGKSLNALTSRDSTEYFVSLPANRLELWFLMESERFKHPVFRGFYLEKEVILEEKRGGQNTVNAVLLDDFFHAAFATHPYRHPGAGYTHDIRAHTVEKARDFFKTFYIPNNMTAAIVGDVKFKTVKRLAEKYFGDLPRGPLPPRPRFKEAGQNGERRVVVESAGEPAIYIGFRTPAHPDRDNLIMLLINQLLVNGRSSRLYKELVIKEKLTQNFFAFSNYPGTRYPALSVIHAKPNDSRSMSQLEAAIYTQLEKFKTEPVAPKEIESVIHQLEASFFQSCEDNLSIALKIAAGAVIYGDMDYEFKKLQELRTITPREIMETAKKYFKPSNRTVGVLQAKAESGGAK